MNTMSTERKVISTWKKKGKGQPAMEQVVYITTHGSGKNSYKTSRTVHEPVKK